MADKDSVWLLADNTALPFQPEVPIFHQTSALMNHPKAPSGLLAVLLAILFSPVHAQFNLKSGYNFSWLPDSGTDRLIGLFNTPEHTNTFPTLTWLHGFEAGMRYKSGASALELGYQGGYRSLRAEGTRLSDGTAFTDKLKFAVHAVTLGYIASGEVFGLGAELQYQWNKTTAKLEEPVGSFKHSQPMWAYSFFMTFTFAGNNNIDMVLKPYYTIPDKPYDPDPLRSFNGADIQLERRKWNRFGLSLIFYNGPKE
jgi:hypothetical protein